MLQKHGKMLYDGVSGQVTAHLGEVAAAVRAQSGSALLNVVSERWEHHVKTMRMISDILMYMVRGGGGAAAAAAPAPPARTLTTPICGRAGTAAGAPRRTAPT